MSIDLLFLLGYTSKLCGKPTNEVLGYYLKCVDKC